MQKVNVTIEGITPLLQNRFIEACISEKGKKKSGATKTTDPEEKLYKLPDGKIYTPSTQILGCIINAAKNRQIAGKKKATYSKLAGSSLNIEPDAIPHRIQKWEPFTVSAINPMTKGRMMVTRPMFPKWSLSFVIVLEDEDSFPIEELKWILDYGGQYVGIGDWRPDKKGKYGKFIVTKFEPS